MRGFDPLFASGTVKVAKNDSRAWPFVFHFSLDAGQMEYVTATQLHTRPAFKSLDLTNVAVVPSMLRVGRLFIFLDACPI